MLKAILDDQQVPYNEQGPGHAAAAIFVAGRAPASRKG